MEHADRLGILYSVSSTVHSFLANLVKNHPSAGYYICEPLQAEQKTRPVPTMNVVIMVTAVINQNIHPLSST